MSKPTERQKKLIAALRSQLDYWEDSNDIHSPSHTTEVGELSNAVYGEKGEDLFSDEELRQVEEALIQLHYAIACVDPCPIRAGNWAHEKFYHMCKKPSSSTTYGEWVEMCFEASLPDKWNLRPGVQEKIDSLPRIQLCIDPEDEKILQYKTIVKSIFTA